MPKALEELTIGEISGVDHPAHLAEGWMVLKAAGASPEAMAQVEIVEDLVEAISKAAVIDPEMLRLVGTEVLDDTARATLASLTKATQEATDMPDAIDKASLSPEVLAYVESLETQVTKAAEDAAAAAPEPKDDEATEIAKALDGLPEVLRKAWLQKDADLSEATAVAKAERDIRLDAEYLAKAKGFSNLTVDPKELAPLLRKVAEVDADLFVKVDQILKAADAQVAEADLFGTSGSAAIVEGDGSAQSELDSIAKAAVASGEAADYPTALAKAATDNPDLYAAHRRESIAASKEG